MAFDPIFPGHEDLYEPSKIYLFGKPFSGLKYVREELAGSEFNSQAEGQRLDMPPPETEETLLRDRFGPESAESKATSDSKPFSPGLQATERNKPQLARIYSFSHEGHYFKLPRPLLYLVWGDGQSPDNQVQRTESGLPSFETLNTGLEGKGWRFASDIKVWKMDEHDKSMVVDFEIGRLEKILLDPIYEGFDDTTMSSRAHIASRAHMASRAHLASRAHMASRAHLASRAHMAGAHQD